MKLVGHESATVPAGTFANACKIEVKDNVTAQALGTSILVDSVLWATPSIGTVKNTTTTPTTFGTANTLIELMSASVGGVNVP
jgi:hypothetical protein